MFGRKSEKIGFQGKSIYEIDEYLEIERQLPETYEFWNMDVMPLNRPDDLEVKVCRSLGKFSEELANRNYKLFLNFPFKKKKVWIKSENCLFYPDLFVVEDEIEFYPDRQDIVSNPRMIIEVSHFDTMAGNRNGERGDQTYLTDRTSKFWKYQKISSLKEYVIIAHIGVSVLVETYNRQDNKSWKYRAFSEKENAVAHFESIDIKLPVTEFYI